MAVSCWWWCSNSSSHLNKWETIWFHPIIICLALFSSSIQLEFEFAFHIHNVFSRHNDDSCKQFTPIANKEHLLSPSASCKKWNVSPMNPPRTIRQRTKLCSCGLWPGGEIVNWTHFKRNMVAHSTQHTSTSELVHFSRYAQMKLASRTMCFSHYSRTFQRNHAHADFCATEKSKTKQFRLQLQGKCPIFGYFIRESVIWIKKNQI